MTVMKTCTMCGISLPIDDFQLDNSKSDGRKSICPKCKAKIDYKYRRSTAGIVVENAKNSRDRARYHQDEEYAQGRRETVRKSNATQEGKAKLKERDGRPEVKRRKAAMGKVEQAVKTGKLVRPEVCEKCGCRPGLTSNGRSKIRAYHYNGHDPKHALDVKWWCASCVNLTVSISRRK